MAEQVDIRFEQLNQIIAEKAASEEAGTLENEADARLTVVNQVLSRALGWTTDQVKVENHVGDSGFSDYELRLEGLTRVVVEAKADGKEFGLKPAHSGRSFKLDGPLFKEASISQGISQAIAYCGEMSAELACVTNGRQWVIFRGSRAGDGLRTRSGVAFVFADLDGLKRHFRLFHDLICVESVKSLRFRAEFQEAEGRPIRESDFRRSIVAPGAERLLPGGEMSADIDRIMKDFFSRMSGEDDPEMLAKCFVETSESRKADSQLVRISESAVTQLTELGTSDGEALADVIDRVATTSRKEFVVIVGTKGAGKSTFLQRFFKFVLPADLEERCAVVRVNVGDATSNADAVETWLDRQLILAAENLLFPDGAPTFDEIRGMFYDEYNRLRKGTWLPKYEADKAKFKEEFGAKIESLRESSPHDYLKGLLRHICANKKQVPVLVFDNADQFDIDFQQRVYQYGRAIFENSLCLVLLPITDRTNWQLSKHGALQSFEHETLFLPTPSTSQIIRKRLDYLAERAEDAKHSSATYFTERGIGLTVTNLEAFTQALNEALLNTGEVAEWIGRLANYDVRRALELARRYASSPHLGMESLVTASVTGQAYKIGDWKAVQALTKGNYSNYPVGQNEFVQNVFHLNEDVETSPLLGLTVLTMLRDAPIDDRGDRFLAVDNVLSYCLGLGVETQVTVLWLASMLEFGFCLSHDPTITSLEHSAQIQIAPAGAQHLDWCPTNWAYLGAMAEVTPFLDKDAFDLIRGFQPKQWLSRAAAFIDYLIEEDSRFIAVPEGSSAYADQVHLRERFSTAARNIRGKVRTFESGAGRQVTR